MWLIGLTISLLQITKAKALECVSMVSQKCMPRPKILVVNEGVGEALFYPYNVLVNKCSGSCDTINTLRTEDKNSRQAEIRKVRKTNIFV